MSTEIRPIESDGQFWIDISLDGHETRYGPYSDATAAAATAARMGAVCRSLFHQPVIMQHPARSRP